MSPARQTDLFKMHRDEEKKIYFKYILNEYTCNVCVMKTAEATN